VSENPPSFKAAMLAALPSLRAFAMSLTGRHDQADDLVQETVMKAWARQSDFTLGTNMNAWLFTILRNLFYSQMRKRGREVQDVDGVYSSRLASRRPTTGGWTSPTSARRSMRCRRTSARRSC
jgi:RNA polymerase sigma-70 factor, ECF subfamily